MTDEQTPVSPAVPNADPKSALASSGVSACIECGRQDETLRIASYPYVFSLFIATFHRAYQGVWCRKHGGIKLTLAAFLSAFFGWIGIPYGLIATPGTLFKLAKGGVVSEEANAQLLKRIANLKILKGDAQSAARCLESALFVKAQDEDAQRRLSDLYRKFPTALAYSSISDLFPTLAVLAAAAIMGGAIGVLDDLITRFLNLSGNVDFWIVVFSWVPLVGLLFLGGVLFARLLDFVLRRMHARQRLLGAALAGFTALLAVYGVVGGYSLSEHVASLISGVRFGSTGETLMKTGSVLVRGGAWLLRDMLASGESVDLIYVVILACGFAFYLVSNLTVADRVIQWKQRLEQLRPQMAAPQGETSLVSWGALLAVALAIVVSFAFFTDVSPGTRPGSDYIDALARAELLYSAGDIPGAVHTYQEAIALNPEDPWAYTYLGWIYIQQGEYVKAEALFLDALAQDPDHEDARMGYALTETALGNYDEALSYLQTLIADSADDEMRANAYSALSDVHIGMGDDAQGLRDLQTAVSLSPDNAHLYSDLGFYYYSHAQYPEAVEAFSSALDIDPALIDSQFGMSFSLLAVEDYDAAAENFQSLLDAGVEGYLAVQAYVGLGRCQTELVQPVEAIQNYESALALDPSHIGAWNLVLIEYLRVADFEKALEQSEAYIASFPASSTVYALRAIAAYMLDESAVMDEALQNALEVRGEDAYGMFFTASALSNALRFSDAEALLLEARQIDPDEDVLLISLIEVYIAEQKYDAALAGIEQYRAVSGETKDSLLSEGYLRIEQGDLDAAETALTGALALAADDWEVRNDLAFLYLQQERNEQALIEAQEALNLNPYYAPAYKNLALASYELGDVDAAMQAALESLRLNPKYDVSHYALGLCYMQQGEEDLAIAEFETFLELYWDRPSARRFKESAEMYLQQL
jgi:tetratricopeptide (TPR) repeat protein